MPRNKRPAEDGATQELDDGNIHPSRSKRLKYSEQDAQLAGIYNDLADEVQSVRIKAAGDLLKSLAPQSANHVRNLGTAESRLIRGLCSGRKAARLGFSVALAEVFRLKFNANAQTAAENINLQLTIDNISKLTTVHGNVSGQEKRDHGLGRRFALQAVLQSDVGLDKRLSEDQWRHLVTAILDLASQKQWLRRECGTMLHEYLASANGSKLSNSRVRLIVEELINYKLVKLPEGVGIWITVQRHFPELKLPKGVWHHRDPLSSKERQNLTRIMAETATDDELPVQKSGSRQALPSFVWVVVLSELFQRGDVKEFGKFWESAARWMFSPSSSVERKALGLQILSHAIGCAPKSMLSEVLRPSSILQYIFDQRAKQDKYLFDAAKLPLQRAVARTKETPELAETFIKAFIEIGAPNLDQLTKTKTIENLASEADALTLGHVVGEISDRIFEPAVSDTNEAHNQRRNLVDLLLNFVRVRDRTQALFKPTPSGGVLLDSSAAQVVWKLARIGYGQPKSKARPPIADSTRELIRHRLMSCLGVFINQPLERASIACLEVINIFSRLKSTGEGWQPPNEQVNNAVERAATIAKNIGETETASSSTHAFQLLFCLSIMQVYNDEADGLAALQDLLDCYDSRDEEDSSTLLVELLLSIVSKPSAMFRKLAEQVFAAFAPQLTADGLQSFIDILEQKESLSGQQALFADNEAGDINGSLDETHDDAIDVEDDSDVELVNGSDLEGTTASENEEGETSEGSSEADGPTADDEEAAFDKKLAEALGTTGDDDNSDDDGSDMDDEQMMALEPHLTSIFKERQKLTSKKQERKDAKENIVNFKNRVLDLMMIYVKSQYASILALDLILPLTVLTRTTNSKPTAEKAFGVLKQYYDACSKHKRLPSSQDPEACFSLLEAVHEEVKSGGSKLHASACSRSSLFLCKLLVTIDQALYERVAGMYLKTQAEWYLNPNSKVPGNFFTEWTNWSITTRKQR